MAAVGQASRQRRQVPQCSPIGASGGSGSAGRERITRALIDPAVFNAGYEQLSLFSAPAVQQLAGRGITPALAGQIVKEDAVRTLASAL